MLSQLVRRFRFKRILGLLVSCALFPSHLLAQTVQSPRFDAPNVFAVYGESGHVPPSFTAVADGDFNGDGIPDFAAVGLACAAGLGDSVAVFLGNGDGSFQPVAIFPAGHCATSVATARLEISPPVESFRL